MRVSLKSLAAGLLGLGAWSLSASAAQIVFQTTVDANTTLQPQVGGGSAYVLASYDFTTQGFPPDPQPFPSPYNQITSIDSITVDLQASDPDAGPLDFAGNNQLQLAFQEGANVRLTGLFLNSVISSNNAIAQFTISGAISNAAAILADLQADGILNAVIVDTSPGGGQGDFISFIDVTTLSITGTVANGVNPVPLPAAAILAPIGAGLAGMYARRFRKQK